jgi:hypothetical protein
VDLVSGRDGILNTRHLRVGSCHVQAIPGTNVTNRAADGRVANCCCARTVGP